MEVQLDPIGGIAGDRTGFLGTWSKAIFAKSPALPYWQSSVISPLSWCPRAQGGIGAHLCDIVPPREKFRSHFTVMLKVAPIQESLEIAGHVQSSGKSPVLGVELR